MPRRKWCWGSVCAEAGKYTTVRAFKYGSPGAYGWAERNDVLEGIKLRLAGRGKPNGYWSEEHCMGIALGYEFLADFIANELTCYKRAQENGFLHKITAHMDRSQSGGDYDAVYCWVVTSAANDDVVSPMPGYQLCKVGLTSARLGDKRPVLCSEKNKMGMELVGIMQTPAGRAIDYERLMKSTGTYAGVPDHYDGYTEFRIFSDSELDDMRQLLCA